MAPTTQARNGAQRRAHTACLNCRKRKIRCSFDADAPPDAKCIRCARERIDCKLPRFSRRGGVRNVIAGRERQRKVELSRLENSPAVTALRGELYSVSDALSILNHVNKSKVRRHTQKRSLSQSEIGEDAELMDVVIGNNEGEEGSDLGQDDDDDRDPDQGSLYSDSESDTTMQEPPVAANVPLSKVPIVANGMVTEEEASALIEFYFRYMGPSLPFVPNEYADPHRLANEPLLFAVIACLAARFFVAPGHKPTSLETQRTQGIHVKLWKYCLNETSSYWWNVPNENVRSTIFAFILLTEWAPISISDTSDGSGPQLPVKEQQDNYARVLRRYSRLCWLLIGQAVRLSQDSGWFETDLLMYVALHQVDHVLSCRLGRAPMLQSVIHQDMPSRIADQLTMPYQARMDVIKLLHLTYNTLYPSREKTTELIESGNYIQVQTMLLPHFQKWEHDYAALINDRDGWESRSIRFEYNHCRLYAFSLGSGRRVGQMSLKSLEHLHQATKFLKLAVESARYVIDFVSDSHSLTPVRCAPIRWMVRLMHATVFLAKILLFPTLNAFQVPQFELVDFIRRATAIMDRAVPEDRLELSQGYAQLLRSICDKLEKTFESHSHKAELFKVPVVRGQEDPEQTATTANSPFPVAAYDSIQPSPPNGPNGPNGVHQGSYLSVTPSSNEISASEQTTPLPMRQYNSHNNSPDKGSHGQVSRNSPNGSHGSHDSHNQFQPPGLYHHSQTPYAYDKHRFNGGSMAELKQKDDTHETNYLPLDDSGQSGPSLGWLYAHLPDHGDDSIRYMPNALERNEAGHSGNTLSSYISSIPGDGFGYLDDPDFGTRLLQIQK